MRHVNSIYSMYKKGEINKVFVKESAPVGYWCHHYCGKYVNIISMPRRDFIRFDDRLGILSGNQDTYTMEVKHIDMDKTMRFKRNKMGW